MTRVLLITTGGTIDAEAYPVEGGEIQPPKNATILPESAVAQRLSTRESVRVASLDPDIAKDSKDITLEELERMVAIIEAAPESRVLITMGTDYMSQHALVLKKLLAGSGKAVVFTGAHVQQANGGASDGLHNVETALAHLETMAPGVDVVIPRGLATRETPEIWEAGTKVKDLTTLTFVDARELPKQPPTQPTKLTGFRER